MPPLKSFTLNAILREWKAPVYDGLCNAKEWLSEIDKGCDIYGIPLSQRITVAIHFMAGEPQVVIDSMRKTKIAEESEVPWTWESFQTDFIAIDKAYKESIPRSDTDAATSDFKSQHPYAYAAIGVTLMGVGTVVVAPALTAGILGAIGFGSAGVTAGSIAAFIQSTFYGAATGGLFAILQSIGATIVAPPLIATGLGATAAAMGGWFTFGRKGPAVDGNGDGGDGADRGVDDDSDSRSVTDNGNGPHDV